MKEKNNSNKGVKQGMARNPAWKRDEVILALDLYFSLKPGEMSTKNEKVIKLSHILSSLPIHSERRNHNNFRNPNSVVMKLGNFKSIDPNYTGEGLKAGSILDKSIWNEFHQEKIRLNDVAKSIVLGTVNLEIEESSSRNIEEEDFPEGKILYRLHKSRERNNKLVREKKKSALLKNNLKCEVCEFDFKKIYGDLGEGYIECHHITPISQYNDMKNTKLEELILVCSNCHRMLHRKRPWLSKNQLKSLLQKNE